MRTMAEVVKSRVSTEATSWYSRMLAAPLSSAPLLLRCMLFSSPASRLMRVTRSALQHGQVLNSPCPISLYALQNHHTCVHAPCKQ